MSCSAIYVYYEYVGGIRRHIEPTNCHAGPFAARTRPSVQIIFMDSVTRVPQIEIRVCERVAVPAQ